MADRIPEISWFSGLCDDDYEFLGVPQPELASSWEHCRDIVQTADRHGFDNILLPSGYTLGIDSAAFTAGIATHTEQIHLLLAVRMGEMWPPQLARQIATIDRMCGGRLTINIMIPKKMKTAATTIARRKVLSPPARLCIVARLMKLSGLMSRQSSLTGTTSTVFAARVPTIWTSAPVGISAPLVTALHSTWRPCTDTVTLP